MHSHSPLVGVALALTQALLLFPGAAQGYVTMSLFSDNDCQVPVPGSGSTTVNSGSCDTNVGTGWLSAQITDDRDSPAGTLTFYTNNNCAAGQSSHGYSSANFACPNNFGFVANAVGLIG
ncbi:hypothetical protein PG996_011878 [Apiospora saccharicola]|uniref:Uncharacterized protein n=1 Tax=Apiospora saccharicola TaxID=335842 RepID=A0ABR1UG97_9PEZI